MTNRLSNETSPYLLQHAHNPVDWYPWGDDAFAKSRSENKPIFLSIGYSACHWCHVMERESFEKDEIAAVLNEHFVSIKVDREERPDVDSIYMQAVQMMTGHGGWPMSMFLTPEGVPFYGGTYFPPKDRHGMPSFTRVLEHVAEAYREKTEDVKRAGEEIREALNRTVRADSADVTDEALSRAAQRIASQFDRVNGGFGSAPKFPPAMSLAFLINEADRTDDSLLRHIVTFTLRKMGNGGMYDQIGGGFHRYSVDARWLVPHFEKMLYDNALLARVYIRAWQWTKDSFFRRIAEDTLGFVERELRSPEGAFYSTLDADSEGEEGKFYVWSRKEVVELLGDEEGRIFCSLFDITEGGNFEGHNIPNVPRDPTDVARELGVDTARLDDIVSRARCKLYGVRSKRVWPGRDEKVLTGWNGWMLAAFASAAVAFDSDRWRELARRNAEFLLSSVSKDGTLLRSWKDGRARIPALLEDYSGLALGLIETFEATQERKFLDAARHLAGEVVRRFPDDTNGGFFDTPIDHEKLITRPKDIFDNATPGGNSIMIEVLLKLAAYFDEASLREKGESTLRSLFPIAEKYASGFGFLLSAASLATGRLREIVIRGPKEGAGDLVRAVGRTFVPHRLLVASSVGLPIEAGKEPTDGAAAWVCKNYQCERPVGTASELVSLLSRSE